MPSSGLRVWRHQSRFRYVWGPGHPKQAKLGGDERIAGKIGTFFWNLTFERLYDF